MEIVKEGQDPAKSSIEETCYNCETVFRYNQSDVQSDRDGYYVVCPHCGKFITAKSFLNNPFKKR